MTIRYRIFATWIYMDTHMRTLVSQKNVNEIARIGRNCARSPILEEALGYEEPKMMKLCEKIAPPDKNKHSRDDINSESQFLVCKRKKERAAIVVMAVTMRSWVLSTRIFLLKLCMTVFFFPRVS